MPSTSSLPAVRRWALSVVGACAAILCLAAPGVASAKVEQVRLLDQCDPVTFNAQFGAGFCQRTGSGVSFDDFSAQLNPKDFGHNAWWINASGGRNGITKMNAGDTLHVTNGGGILHTFTEFPQFGGGCIPPFSVPLGLPVIPFVPDCLAIIGATGVPQGTSKDVSLSVGTHRFQCVFHPWMRQTFDVRPADAT